MGSAGTPEYLLRVKINLRLESNTDNAMLTIKLPGDLNCAMQ